MDMKEQESDGLTQPQREELGKDAEPGSRLGDGEKTERLSPPQRQETDVLPAQPRVLPAGRTQAETGASAPSAPASSANAVAGGAAASGTTPAPGATPAQDSAAKPSSAQPAPSPYATSTYPPSPSPAGTGSAAANSVAPNAGATRPAAASPFGQQPTASYPPAGTAAGFAPAASYAQPAAGSAYASGTQGQMYYQPWENPPATERRKWSTKAVALFSALSLVVGAVLGGALGTMVSSMLNLREYIGQEQYDGNNGQIEDGNGWDALPDYGNGSYGDNGFDPFFPEQQSNGSTGTRAEAAPGVLIINSMLTNGIGAGSGIILSEDGYAVTNYHVVEGSTTVQVEVADTGDTYTAQVLGHNAEVDVALLKLEDAKGLEPAEIDTDLPDKGTAVHALGNGGGQGYISRVDGEVTRTNTRIVAQSETTAKELTGLIETDADIVQGYSGGPLLNEKGKVVGMTVAASVSSSRSRDDTNGYAIPAKDVMKVVEQIKSGKSSDKTIVGRNAALGVVVGTARQMNGTMVDGATILQVNQGSVAEKAGLVPGDTITAIDGTRISTAADLSSLIKTFSIGDTITVEYTTQRGEEKKIKIDLGESPVN